jgi:hypothetical protein
MFLVVWQGGTDLSWGLDCDCGLDPPDECKLILPECKENYVFDSPEVQCADDPNPLGTNSYLVLEEDGTQLVGWCFELEDTEGKLVGLDLGSPGYTVSFFPLAELPSDPFDPDGDGPREPISQEQANQANYLLGQCKILGVPWPTCQWGLWGLISDTIADDLGRPFPFNCPNDLDVVEAEALTQDAKENGSDFKPVYPAPAYALGVVGEDCETARVQLILVEFECCKFIKKQVSILGGPFVDADCCEAAPEVPEHTFLEPDDVQYRICVTNCEDKTLGKVIVSDPALEFDDTIYDLGPGEEECFLAGSRDFPCGADDDDASSSVNIATAIGKFNADDDDDASSDRDCAFVLCSDEASCEDDDDH